jgi:hypothetical protein
LSTCAADDENFGDVLGSHVLYSKKFGSKLSSSRRAESLFYTCGPLASSSSRRVRIGSAVLCV